MEMNNQSLITDAMKEMVASAVMLGLSCSAQSMQGSILDESNDDIVQKIMSLHRATGDFLIIAGLDNTADEIMPLFREIIFQLPVERLSHGKY